MVMGQFHRPRLDFDSETTLPSIPTNPAAAPASQPNHSDTWDARMGTAHTSLADGCAGGGEAVMRFLKCTRLPRILSLILPAKVRRELVKEIVYRHTSAASLLHRRPLMSWEDDG
jgi:hypothetical protein